MNEFNQRIIRRLTFIKYLINNGRLFCGNLNDPHSFSTGLLLLHDAVDNCLATVALSINATLKERMFVFDYLKAIRTADEQKRDIPYDSELYELNTLRINIKHKGILPDVLQHKELPDQINNLQAQKLF